MKNILFLIFAENFLTGEVPHSKINFCERFLELMIDIEAQLPTRRFFNVLLEDCHLVVKCQLSNLCKRSEGKLFGQVSESWKFHMHNIDKSSVCTQLVHLGYLDGNSHCFFMQSKKYISCCLYLLNLLIHCILSMQLTPRNTPLSIQIIVN